MRLAISRLSLRLVLMVACLPFGCSNGVSTDPAGASQGKTSDATVVLSGEQPASTNVEERTLPKSEEPVEETSIETGTVEKDESVSTQLADTTPSTKPQQEKPSKPPSNQITDITFDNIKFEIEKDGKFESSMLTDEIESLKGKRIRIRGYMLPSFQQSGITEFVLVRDNMECCFGPGAMIYDCIIVKMDAGATAEFDVKPIAVEGVFDVEPLEIDGELLALYTLQASQAK